MSHVALKMVSPLNSGVCEIEAFGRTADSELVVHPYICSADERDSDRWVVSHRRSGFAISQGIFQTQPSMRRALELADLLTPMFDWSLIDKSGNTIGGPSSADMTALGRKIRDAITAFTDWPAETDSQ